MPPLSILTYSFTVPQSAIDEYGHVNNVIYVQWMQDAATRHGEAVGYKQPENTGVNIGLNISLLLFSEMKLKFVYG